MIRNVTAAKSTDTPKTFARIRGVVTSAPEIILTPNAINPRTLHLSVASALDLILPTTEDAQITAPEEEMLK